MYEMPIERGKIREFAAAVKSENPAHTGDDAIIPPTFLATAGLSWEPVSEAPDLGFDMRRVLLGEEEYIFHGPLPRAGDTLLAERRVADRYSRQGKRGGTMNFAVLVTEFRHAATRRLIAEQRMTVIETAKPPAEV